MIILIPFMILKFREQIEKVRTKENMNQLKDFILNDIIGAIDQNVNLGNLTLADAGRMRNLVAELYRHIYSHYQEFQEEGINDMVDEGLVLEMDIIEYNHKKEMEAKVEEATDNLIKSTVTRMLQCGYAIDEIKKIYPNVTEEFIKNIKEAMER